MSFLFQLICSTKCLCCNCASKHCLASSASKVTTISNTPSVHRKWSQVEENVSVWKTTLQNKFQMAICRSYKQKRVLILSCAFRTPLQAKELKKWHWRGKKQPNSTGKYSVLFSIRAHDVFTVRSVYFTLWFVQIAGLRKMGGILLCAGKAFSPISCYLQEIHKKRNKKEPWEFIV